MKIIHLNIFLFLSLISFTTRSQTSAFPKNHPFAGKTSKISETVIIRYEKEEPTVYSNTTNQALVVFDNKNHETVNFKVFNGENNEVPVMYGKSKAGTEETITIYTSQLAVGTYVCKIETGSNVITRKLIVAR